MIGSALLIWVSVWGQAGPAEPPLWQLAPFDRMTLTNGRRHDIDPIRIPAGTDLSGVPEDEYVGRPGLPPRAEIIRSVRYRVRRQADGLEYDVYGKHIEKIERYEDLLLNRAKQLLREDRFDDCYRHLDALARVGPTWPGLAELRVEFHFREAVRLKVATQWENAYWEFWEAEKEQKQLAQPIDLIPPIDTQVDDLVARWISTLAEKGNLTEARRVIARVESSRPQTPSAIQWKERLIQEASQRREQALQALKEDNKDLARELLESSLNHWPEDPETQSALESLFQSSAHLRIGVEIPPTFFGGPANWSPADLRAIDLIHERMVQPAGGQGDTPWESHLLTKVARPEASLNRRMKIEIAPGLRWGLVDREVSIVDIHRLLTESCRPESVFYHPAFARLVSGMTLEPPSGMVIDFERPQPRPEVWLTLPLLQISRGSDAGWSGLGPFTLETRRPEQIRYRRHPHYRQPGKPIIERVTEQVIPRGADRLRLMALQQIDLALDLPPAHWSNASKIPGARLVTRSQPTVYLLQFNFNQRFLRERTVRRAIRYALDTRNISLSIGLNEKDVARPTAPWPVDSFGYDPTIAPADPDFVLARTLLEASKKKFGSLPILRLAHSGLETDQRACQSIAESLARIGLKVNLAPFETSSPTSLLTADLRYVGIVVQDPVFDVTTLLTRDNPSLAEFASPWLRQTLVDLVDVPNQSAARELLPRLHRVLHDDVSLLPLWQYRERWLVSERVGGQRSESARPYEEIEHWTLRPGIPTQPTFKPVPTTASRPFSRPGSRNEE